MFICKEGHVAKPREKPVRIVTKRRDRVYYNQARKELKESHGWEIVEEGLFCEEHARRRGED